MSVRSELRELEESAARQARIRKKLEEMDAAAAPPEVSPAEATQPSLEHLPPRKPWENAQGHQFRPLTRRERENEDLEQFMAKAVAEHNAYRADCHEAQRGLEVAKKELEARRRKEERTGRRPWSKEPNQACSLEEAARCGHIGGGNTFDDSQYNPYDNSRHDCSRFGR
jgi:hypothetical protein